MKPRFEEATFLKKARELTQRIDQLEKAKCDCGKEPCACKSCPKCKTGKIDKMGNCMKMGCGGKMEKAEPGYKPEKISDVNPHFVAESGGQTKTGYFTTNGKTIEAEDAPKKKKVNEKASMEALASAQNPHEGGGVEREIAAGGKELKKFAGTICGRCGGTSTSGCQMPEMMGTNIKACPAFEPLR